MDAVKFLKEKNKMCHKSSSCNQCEFYKSEVKPAGVVNCRKFAEDYPETTVAFFEKWSAAHPAITRAYIFKKAYPKVSTYRGGTIKICPHDLDIGFECPGRISCLQCKTKYWLEEVQDGRY